MVSLWCELLCKLSIYTLEEWSMDNNMVSKIGVGMTTINIHLLQFKILSHLQKRGFWMPVHENSCWRKTSEIYYITFAILLFSHQNTLVKLLSPVLWSLCASLDETIRCALNWFILTQRMQNLEFLDYFPLIFSKKMTYFKEKNQEIRVLKSPT